MTACVNKKSKRVAAVVTASLVGALSIGAPAVALAANDTSIDLLATDSSAFAKGTVSYKYGMKPGADFTYTGYDQGLVPSKVEVYNGDTVFPQPRPASGKEEVGKSYFYYVQVDDKGKKVDGVKIKNAKGKLVDLVGNSVKDAKGNYVRPSAKGKYAVVLANCTAKNQFDLVSVADTFTITGQSLDGAVLYEGDDMADTDFGFSGAAQSDYADTYLKTLNIALDGVQLDEKDEVSLSIYAKGGSNALGHDVLEIGKTYVVKVDGVKGSRFEGQSVQREFVYGKLDLAKASIVADVFTANAPDKDSTFDQLVDSLNGFPCDGQGSVTDHVSDKVFDQVDVSFVSGPSGSISGGNGVYTYKLAAKPTATHVSGEATIEVHKADIEATVDFNNIDSVTASDETANSFIVDLSQADPDHVDLSDIKVTANNDQLKAADYTVTVKDASGKEVAADALKTPGTYTVTVVCDTELDNGKTVYGTASATVKVLHKVVKASDVFFSYNKQNVVESKAVEYTGEDFSKSFSFKVTSGSAELVQGTDYDVVISKLQADGKKVVVDKVVDAGEYTISVVGKTVAFDNGAKTVTFGFTVDPVTLTASIDLSLENPYGVNDDVLEISDLLTAYKAGQNQNVFDYHYLPATGSVISPKFTYTDVNKNVVELPVDAVEVEYRDANNKVVDLKDAGLYTARVVSKSEASNYLVNYKFTNLKVSESKVFSDVQTSDWFYNAVFNAKKLGYIAGIGDGSLFAPNADIKRGDVAVVLFRMANGEAYGDEDFSFDVDHGFLTGFSDVDGHAYYAKAIAWAAKAGVVNGYADGTFRAEKNITSEEFAAMLSNFAKLKGEDISVEDADAVLAAYPDGSAVSAWAKPAVAWAVENGVMGNGAKLDATSNISRARVAAMAVNYQPDGVEDLIKPSK